MTIKNRLRLLLVLGLLVRATIASAAPITFAFTGVTYAVDASISGTFAVGQSVSGSYTFNSDTVGESFSPGGILDPSITYYPNVLTAFDVTIGTYSFALGTGEQRIFVINNDSSSRDRYLVEMYSPAGANVAGLPVHDFFFGLQDNTGTALDSDSLPLVPPDLTNFSSAAGALDFVTGINPENRVTFRLNSFTAVPAPPAIWLLGTAIAGLGGRRWLRRKTSG